MTRPREDLRHEIKLVCEAFDADAVATTLRLDPAGVRAQWPTRRVQSVYFDTHGGRAVDENLAGISAREKLRFRWYGDARTRVSGRLEKKIRRNLIGWKQSVAVDAPVPLDGELRADVLQSVRMHVPPSWQLELAGLEPAQWIAYDREYLVTFDGRVRVTIDRHITAVDLRDVIRVDARRVTPTPDVVVFELKGRVEDADAIREIAQALPIVVARSSKFVLGSAPKHY